MQNLGADSDSERPEKYKVTYMQSILTMYTKSLKSTYTQQSMVCMHHMRFLKGQLCLFNNSGRLDYKVSKQYALLTADLPLREEVYEEVILSCPQGMVVYHQQSTQGVSIRVKAVQVQVNCVWVWMASIPGRFFTNRTPCKNQTRENDNSLIIRQVQCKSENSNRPGVEATCSLWSDINMYMHT